MPACAEYHLERVTLPQAGSLVFFTDGLIDEGRIDAESRLQSLAALMDRQWAGDLEALADGILNSLSHADSEVTTGPFCWPGGLFRPARLAMPARKARFDCARRASHSPPHRILLCKDSRRTPSAA